MTDEQFVAITANQHAQLRYTQQVTGLLFAHVRALKTLLLEVAQHSGMNRAELETKFEAIALQVDNKISEFPFPELHWPPEDEQ
jgi:hypothetical protein